MAKHRKSFAFQIKATDEAGTFEGLASVYGNKDLQGDVVDRGAFTKTLNERPIVKLLWQHDQHQPIGTARLEDTPAGLKMFGKLTLSVKQAAEAYALLQDGVIDAMSIGYDTVKKSFKDGARHLQELKLWEISLVTFPANEDALVSAVKSLEAIDVKAFGLPAFLECQVAAMLKSAKDASLSERLNNVYSAVRAAFPYSDIYPMSGQVYDDHLICSNGSSKFAWIPITSWDADGMPMLGQPLETEFEDPTEEADEDDGTKAGRSLSAANVTKLKTAHEHATKAVEHMDALIKSALPKKPIPIPDLSTGKKEEEPAAIAEVDPSFAQSLLEWKAAFA